MQKVHMLQSYRLIWSSIPDNSNENNLLGIYKTVSVINRDNDEKWRSNIMNKHESATYWKGYSGNGWHTVLQSETNT